jgi:hypothetical protein
LLSLRRAEFARPVNHESENGFGEDAENAGDEFGIVSQPITQCMRKRQNPLPDGSPWKHTINQMRRHGCHAPPSTGIEEAPMFTRERHRMSWTIGCVKTHMIAEAFLAACDALRIQQLTASYTNLNKTRLSRRVCPRFGEFLFTDIKSPFILWTTVCADMDRWFKPSR